MNGVSECFPLEIKEDVKRTKRARISLSSTDSEPILKRSKRTPNASSSCYDDDDDRDGAVSTQSDIFPSARNDETLDLSIQAVLQNPEEIPPFSIPIERVSQASACIITAVIARDNTLVADNAPGSIVMDVGTRLCLADGSLVGTITTVMGPVSSCVYAITCHPCIFENLTKSGQLNIDTTLCYDLGEQHLIYDPAVQCDTVRGTDASYINDEELPSHIRPDFSDDEIERQWKTERRLGGHSKEEREVSSDEEPVEVDWGKIIALEDSCKAQGTLKCEAKEDGVQDNKANSCSMRLVVPPWLSWHRQS